MSSDASSGHEVLLVTAPGASVSPLPEFNNNESNEEMTMKAIQVLKQQVRSLAEQGKNLAASARSSSGMDRHQWWLEKRKLGTDARYALLAYACIRGVPYKVAEQRCRQYNEPSPTKVFEVMTTALGADLAATWSPEPVKAWLRAELPTEEQRAA
jgi:hypothetical protein